MSLYKQKFILGIFFILSLTISQSAKSFAATIFVDASNTGTEDGSAVNPYNTIQEGVDAASNGDTVQVAAGTYTENITLKTGMTSETTLVSASGAATTIIDGNADGSVITADSNWTIDGFTIQNGQGTAISAFGLEAGAGIFANAKTNITIQNCIISSNTVDDDPEGEGDGAGIGLYDCTSATISNCTFSNNAADDSGGGLLVITDATAINLTVTDCAFDNNTATNGNGGAIAHLSTGLDATMTISGSTFSNNTTGTGGALQLLNGDYTLTNCLIYSNSNAGNGTLQFGAGTSTATVTNCTIANNTGSGIRLAAATVTATIKNCILYGNSEVGIAEVVGVADATPINCDFNNNTNGLMQDEGVDINLAQINALAGASGNISDDPLLVSVADYHLQAQNFGYATDSPCIDAGIAAGAPATDLDGNARPQGDAVDIGAYENSSSNTSAKDANKKRATAGDIITYTITITNNSAQDIANAELRDGLPKGFKYVEGTTTLNNVSQTDPTGTTTRTFTLGTLSANTTYTLRYKLVVGSGVSFGNYTNTATLYSTSDIELISQVSETVTIVANPLFYNATLIGKVFNDKNQNQIQDNNEEGISNIELAIETGLRIKTDQYGRYHINDLKPRTHIIGLDTNTLPKGSSLTTENPILLTPVTEGVTLKANFGVLLRQDDI